MGREGRPDPPAERGGAGEGTPESRQRNTLLKTGALQDAIVNSAYFSSIATDEKGVIQIFNVGAERMLGYAAVDVVNQITPADLSDPQELIARAAVLSLELDTPITPGFEALVFKASRGIEDIYELTWIRKDGSRFPAIVSVTALRDARECILGYLLIGTDNTARKQVEAAQAMLDQRLRDQQFYTRSLIESNIDALMTTDPQGVISDVNQQMIELTGRTRDELIGAPCRNFFTDPARADAAIRRVLTENKVSNYELTVRAQNGEETVVSYNAATIHDRDRKLQGVFAAARDVTERKRFERTLQEKNLELENASRMKSEFLATMSHELRTPLNAIIGFSEALQDGLMGEMSDTQHEYIGDIFSSGQHLLSLINDILDLSKVEAGMMALELEPVDINLLLANSLSIVREKAAAQRIHLDLASSGDLGICGLDMRKTKQIVYNLLSNAVKFSPRGGRVTLSARRVARAEVGRLAPAGSTQAFALAESAHADFLEIRVGDNGIGVSRDDMTKLFQAFSQIDSSLARKFEGTGLGLAMVKKLAELHGGTVAVSSVEGQGACFAVWLPLRPQAVEAGALPAAGTARDADAGSAALAAHEGSRDTARDAGHAGRTRAGAAPTPGPAPAPGKDGNPPRTALVVEDDDLAADLVRLLLEAEGFAVVRAASAEEGLRLAAAQPLVLVTLDLQLPGMDGWEFLRRMRLLEGLALVPVLVIAGLAGVHVQVPGGAAAALQKPVNRVQLQQTLEGLGLQPKRRQTHTVLVVDDEPGNIDRIAAYLPAPAYSVLRAQGGDEGVALARRLLPDLILLDLLMPGTDGYAVLAALRADPATARIPVLVVTDQSVSAQQRDALSLGGDQRVGLVDKAGFNRSAFTTEVRRALRGR